MRESISEFDVSVTDADEDMVRILIANTAHVNAKLVEANSTAVGGEVVTERIHDWQSRVVQENAAKSQSTLPRGDHCCW